MVEIRYLVEEVAAGLQIYCTGRLGSQTLKSAFILCDDYCELLAKAYLLDANPSWSEQRPSGNSFKSFHEVQKELVSVAAASGIDPATVRVLSDEMISRRKRRNELFHSTRLLDLSVSQTNVARALVDLLDLGAILFGSRWSSAVSGAPLAMEALELIVRLDVKAVGDPSVPARLSAILANQPRNVKSVRARGAHVAEHPADIHTLMCLAWGDVALIASLRTLLGS